MVMVDGERHLVTQRRGGQRDADTANSTYTVSYAKSSAAGMGLEGVLKVGKGAGPTLPGGLPMGFEGKLKGEGAPK